MNILGVDLGGQNELRLIKLADWEVLDFGYEGNFDYQRLQRGGPFLNPTDLLNFLANAAKEADLVGISVCGTIKNNRVISSPNLKWIENLDLEEAINHSARISNDIHSMAAGIKVLMPELGGEFMAFTLSSGVGAKIVWHNEIMADTEPGHIVIDPSINAPRCGCGTRGCLEAFCGGSVTEGTVRNIAESYGKKLSGRESIWRQLDKAREKEEDWAVEYYDRYADNIGRWIKAIRSIMPVENFIYKGSMAIYGWKWIEPGVRKALRRYGMNSHWEKAIRFYRSPEPDIDAILGAGLLALEYYKY